MNADEVLMLACAAGVVGLLVQPLWHRLHDPALHRHGHAAVPHHPRPHRVAGRRRQVVRRLNELDDRAVERLRPHPQRGPALTQLREHHSR